MSKHLGQDANNREPNGRRAWDMTWELGFYSGLYGDEGIPKIWDSFSLPMIRITLCLGNSLGVFSEPGPDKEDPILVYGSLPIESVCSRMYSRLS